MSDLPTAAGRSCLRCGVHSDRATLERDDVTAFGWVCANRVDCSMRRLENRLLSRARRMEGRQR